MSYVDGQRFAFFSLICLMFACDDVQPLTLTLNIENRSLVLGQDVQINAISSQKVNIEWKIIQRPNGSTNPIEAIDVLDGYQSHFLPDKLGQYTILATAKTSESSKSATISVEINCAPPAWDIELNTPQGLIGQIGQQTDLFANLKTIDQVGCEGIEPLSPMISWRLISKPTESSATLIPIAESVRRMTTDQVGEYLIEASVTDAFHRMQSDQKTIQVTCGNQAPTLSLMGPNQANMNRQPISIKAIISDADQDCGLEQSINLSWQWLEKPNASTAQLNQIDGLSPWFIPDQVGLYRIQAIATDTQGLSSRADLEIEVNACGSNPPVIQEILIQGQGQEQGQEQEQEQGQGQDGQQVFHVGQSIAFDLRYEDLDQTADCDLIGSHQARWLIKSAPFGSQAQIQPIQSFKPRFSPDLSGRYEIMAQIIDESGHQSEKTIIVQVDTCGQAKPSVSLMADAQNLAIGQATSLTAIALDTDEACGIPQRIRYDWQVLSMPPMAQGLNLMENPTDLNRISFVPTQVGTYVIGVKAIDQSDQISDLSSIQIDVSNCGRIPPIFSSFDLLQGNRSIQSNVQQGEATLLSARLGEALQIYPNLEDPNIECGFGVDQWQYHWTLVSKPINSQSEILNADASFLSINLDLLGRYTFEVKVQSANQEVPTRQILQIDTSTCGTAYPTIEWLSGEIEQSTSQQALLIGEMAAFSIAISDLDTLDGCQLPQDFEVQWSMIAQPAGSQARMSENGNTQNWFIPDLAGFYTLEIKVRDPQGHESRSQKEIEVLGCRFDPPENLNILVDRLMVGLDEQIDRSWHIGDTLVFSSTWADLRQPIDDRCLSTMRSKEEMKLNWQVVERPIGSLAVLQDPNHSQSWLKVDQPGRYLIEVQLEYALGQSIQTQKSIEISPCGALAPLVRIQTDRLSINQNQLTTLQAIVSDFYAECQIQNTADLSQFKYHWSLISAPPTFQIENFQTSLLETKQSILPWQTNVAGQYRFSVVAVDDQNRSSLPAMIDLEVLPCGALAPELESIQVIGHLIPQSPLKLAIVAQDPNDRLCDQPQALSYHWRVLSQPSTSNFAFTPELSRQAQPNLVLTEPGIYVFELEVRNALDLTVRQSISFELSTCGASRPIADIQISHPTPQVGQSISFSAIDSFDPDALSPCLIDSELTYDWQIQQVPAGYDTSFGLAQNQLFGTSPWFYIPIAGIYEIGLTVSDQTGRRSLAKSIRFEAQGCGDQAPWIEQIVLSTESPQVGEVLSLQAIVKDDDLNCGGLVEADVHWTIIDAPVPTSLDLISSKSVSFSPNQVGTYLVEALAIGRDGRQSNLAKRISFEVNDCGAFSPMIALKVQQTGDLENPVVGDEILVQASTSDADELGACALNQSRSIEWSILSKPINSTTTFSLAPNDQILGEKASQSAIRLLADQVGAYRIEAIVRDQSGKSSAKTIQIHVESCIDPTPTIKQITRSNAPYYIGQAIDLIAEKSPLSSFCTSQTTSTHAQTDPLQQNGTWSWQILSRPSQSFSLLSGNQNFQRLIPDQAGTYLISVTYTSISGKVSAPQLVELSVVDCGKQKPVIRSVTSTPQNLNQLAIGQTVDFSVQADDPDALCGQGKPLMPVWRLTKLPNGSQATLASEQGFDMQFTPDVAGLYEITLQVFEEGSQASSDIQKLQLQVGDCGAQSPQALIAFSAPKTSLPSDLLNGQFYACSGASFVQLDAKASVDPNTACGGSDTLTYQWQVLEISPGLSARLIGSSAQTLNLALQGLTASQNAQVKVKLTVQNELGRTDDAFAVIDLFALDQPHTLSINPSFFCGQAQQVQLTGINYYRYQNQLPSLEIAGLELQASAISNCVNLVPNELDRCTNLTVNIPGNLSAELYQAQVKNPYPLACRDAQAPSIFVLSAPKIDQISPRPICRGQFNGNLTLSGSGLLKVPALNQETQIFVNNIQALQTQITDCENVSNFQLCRKASFELPISQKDVANLNVKLANPNPSACLASDLEVTYLFKQSEPPIINDIVPKKICDQGGSLDLIGDHFESGMTVALGPYLADTVQNISGEQRARATWQVQNTQRFVPNLYTVTARNATGCSTTSPILVRVTEGPVPFFVDPPIVYNGVTLQATAYLGNLFGGSVTKVEISRVQGSPINLDFSFDPSKPSQIKLIIPSGLTPGTYDLTLYDDVNCPGSTSGLLKITNQLGLTIASVDPPFAWNQGTTAITTFAGGNSQFIPTPRSYLTPSVSNQCTLDQQCGGGKVCRQGRCTNLCATSNDCVTGFACSAGACVPQASELKASSLKNITTLQGIVPAGFATGFYDLVVVNPNGQVGLLTKAIKVNVDPPPQIEGVSPGSWKINEPALAVQISGTGFSQSTVTATCVSNGQSTQYPVTIISQNATLIDTRIDTSVLSANTVCSIRVLNADASYDDFSPMTTVNPSGNFVSFFAETNLPANASRRLPAVVATNIPNANLALFMIAGDLGSTNTALDDVYTTQIDGFGRLGTWEKLPNRLPNALTYTQAVAIGRFIYVIGGMQSNGQGSNQVLRAEILDPLYVPKIEEVDFDFDPNIDGLSTGVYYYRVTAIYGANDPNNPNGESLASEPQPVFIPDISIGVRLQITWTALTDAVGYRIYRSPTPNLLLGQEQLIGEVDATTLRFSDAGILPIAQQNPLKQGDLGRWKQVATLNSTRSQHAVVVANDPIQAKLQHVYVFAGLQNGVSSRSYEHFSVNLSNERQHVLSNVSLFNASLSIARTKLNALLATPQEASFLSLGTQPKKTVIYVLGGDNTRTVEVAEVLSNGLLSPWVATADMSRTRIGYAAGIANNTLLTVCGQNGSASTTAEKGEICGLNCSPAVETVSRWSALGNTGALRSCVDPGFASAKGFFYLIGGGDGNSAISSKIDVSLLGGTP